MEEVAGVEIFIAEEFEEITVEVETAGFCNRLNRGGAITAVLRAIVGSQHCDAGARIDIRAGVQRSVAAVIPLVAANEFPVVALRAATVPAAGGAPIDAYGTSSWGEPAFGSGAVGGGQRCIYEMAKSVGLGKARMNSEWLQKEK